MNTNKRVRSMTCRILPLAFLLGAGLLAVSALATRSPEGYLAGFPMRMAESTLPCPRPNPLNGCGFSYVPWIVGLDLFFWVGVASIMGLFLSLIFLPHQSEEAQPSTNEAEFYVGGLGPRNERHVYVRSSGYVITRGEDAGRKSRPACPCGEEHSRRGVPE